eukprot:ANDGO_03745.mRNA.1 hypothetical protein
MPGSDAELVRPPVPPSAVVARVQSSYYYAPPLPESAYLLQQGNPQHPQSVDTAANPYFHSSISFSPVSTNGLVLIRQLPSDTDSHTYNGSSSGVSGSVSASASNVKNADGSPAKMVTVQHRPLTYEELVDVNFRLEYEYQRKLDLLMKRYEQEAVNKMDAILEDVKREKRSWEEREISLFQTIDHLKYLLLIERNRTQFLSSSSSAASSAAQPQQRLLRVPSIRFLHRRRRQSISHFQISIAITVKVKVIVIQYREAH